MKSSEHTYRIYDVNAGVPEIPESFLMGYIMGNAMWPQKHFATSIFVAHQAFADNRSFSELSGCQFSVGQLDKIVKSMNKAHRNNQVSREFPEGEELVDERSISIEEINYLWERSIFGAANRVIFVARMIPSLGQVLTDFSNLRDLYYQDKDRALQELGRLDNIMSNYSLEFDVVSQIFDRIKYHITHHELRELAARYRNVITAYKGEGGNDQREYLLIKSDIVNEATLLLMEKLAGDFPEIDWSNFDSSH